MLTRKYGSPFVRKFWMRSSRTCKASEGPSTGRNWSATLNAQGAGIPQRIKQSIAHNLRSGYLMLYPGNKIGLPDWKKIAELGESD